MRCLLLLAIMVIMAGCAQIEYERINEDGSAEYFKVNTFFWDVDFEWFQWRDVILRKFDGKSKDIKALTPWGTVETVPFKEK